MCLMEFECAKRPLKAHSRAIPELYDVIWVDWVNIMADVTAHCTNRISKAMVLVFNSSPPSATFMCQWTGSALAWSKRHQAITLTNADLLPIGPLGTNFSENWIEILIFSFKKMHLKMLSANRQSFCPRGDELKCKIGRYLFTMSMRKDFKQVPYQWQGTVVLPLSAQYTKEVHSFILVISHEVHGISDHWQYDCLFNNC